MAVRNCSAWRWCMVFCASVLVFSNACEALQKFSSRECKSNTDCAAIANTTCMRHPEDTKMRCLCGEKKSPQNGACHHSKQGLHHKCNVDEDCIRHAACKAPTNSSNVPRTCECKEDYDEEDHECSSSLPTRLPCSQAVFLLLFYPVLQLIQ